MRVVQPAQTQIGELKIADIKIDIKSRDDIPQILRGLQHLYLNIESRAKVFALLETHIQPAVSKNTGRPGMNLWTIFVMGVLRLDLNWDYDRLHEQVNNHKTIREMLGHSSTFDEYYYELQTLKDNVRLLTPELLEEVNQVIVEMGHDLVKKKGNEVLRGRCDSFVVETHVHYPTDINLLSDAMRKVITLTGRLCEAHNDSSWRQYSYNEKQVRREMRKVQNKKRARGGKTEAQREKRRLEIAEAHRDYIELAGRYLTKARDTLTTLGVEQSPLLCLEIQTFIAHADRQIDQIDRRVLQGEQIAHEEKVFSLFEPHTEWISKGKAGVPVELGLRVCILEDHHQFILHHRVMEKETDADVAVEMVKASMSKYPELHSCSFDKGFHSPGNQAALSKELSVVGLPRKGKLSKPAREWESSEPFRQARRGHAAVESAINGLEMHGLDRCRDKGIVGFKRYVALSIVARNLQRVGAILIMKERKRLVRQHRKRLKQAA